MDIQATVENLIGQAILNKASDVYFLPLADTYEIHQRVQQHKQVVARRSYHEILSVLNYLKYQAQMNISENRRPQTGVMSYQFQKHVYQLRLSTIGNFENRESMVVRILYPQQKSSEFYVASQEQTLFELCQQRGLVVLSGPTGSGKTTTLYHLATQLSETQTVIAVEDPTEIKDERILQLQVNEAAAMDYVTLLSGVLRHRPDVLIVGEIRNSATAQAAITAALSGHLVLTTLHARSTGGVVERLLDLGITPVLLKNALTGICYQRLIPDTDRELRLLCDILKDNALSELIQNPRQVFVQWHYHLDHLLHNGKITTAVHNLFYQG
ncbi:competence type IV pilus ATPase ComGA [Agrilactobacillus fermenti]|uniref:competence type IV pilus ATPase ComGA n=1 Tax=Agrilactobacillus fermenti TaxID=2586909 RepID=UPI001E3B5081|nr:competence type IV pilus ATPase ComGA [Agrilactobacillus fermenti]MCD2256315.1 Flp pilus assembly complex ATPase component TadA [Agrilactobacillus fermenti]